ncbi:clathrin interactor EPSIN 1 [Daucus carota subsp. sativus]|uniref:clathrin interactor EPSIN 1 n=1 Tax=Daucus carota subsp. sativus TaxID=79200 RepID=UPI0007B27446|nr:PREDICTED: clathrin interactor EPSIN 1 [Daucus carota subsp. sativus]XP_017229884.1 PREDICTED: clathrin interactor EPSIN 1 [Daucus carota subsp. sativus]
MDFMKVFDQTVREIKREVNLKVLKVPEIEQKVLDATDDEPWGPHGTVLAEIAQATKKFSECQMVMNVLWTRLTETGRNWRFVYKSLAVIEYLVANGSERAVDDIIEHTFQISALSSFEYVEPSGKDMGINVRKKVENIVALLNNKDKIQEVRDKASATRDKYFGLSSTGITYKSGSAALGSSSSRGGDRYGGFGNSRDADAFSDSYKDRDRFGEDSFQKSTSKTRRGATGDNFDSSLKKGTSQEGRFQGTSAASKQVKNKNDNHGSPPSQSSTAPSNKYEDTFDDFDPRGTSSKPAAVIPNEVDLFGLLDAPASVPTENHGASNTSADVDLFADADFVSAPSNVDSGANVDLFSSHPASSTVDFFAAPDPVTTKVDKPFASQHEVKPLQSEQMNTTAVDPFAAVPLNNYDSSDFFGSFTSQTDSSPKEPVQKGSSDVSPSSISDKTQPPPKTGGFQVKSGIWADSLSRGLIDLNISAPKKVNLADVGVVGGLTETDDNAKATQPSYHMGRAMGSGSGLGISGFTSPSGDDFFSSSSSQDYQFGGFQK